MSTLSYSPQRLVRALEAEGFDLPQECREVKLVMGMEMPILMYECLVTEKQLAALGRALARLAADDEKGQVIG